MKLGRAALSSWFITMRLVSDWNLWCCHSKKKVINIKKKDLHCIDPCLHHEILWILYFKIVMRKEKK